MAALPYLIAMGTSTTFLVIPCAVSWRQFCCIGDPDEKRFNRTVFVMAWATLIVILNVLMYVSNLFYHALLYWTYLLEVFLVVFGMFNFQSLALAFVDNMYGGEGNRPKWISVAVYALVVFVDIAALCFYGPGLFSSMEVDMKYIRRVYIFLSATNIVAGILTLIVIRPISQMLKESQPDTGSRRPTIVIRSISAWKALNYMVVVWWITALVYIVLGGLPKLCHLLSSISWRRYP